MSSAPRRALLVVDVQNEYFSGNLRIEYPEPQQSLANIGRAMDAATAAGIPVIVVRHLAPAGAPIFAPGSVGAELHPEIARRPCDLLFDKHLASCFAGTELADWLQQRGIDTLSVVGYMTHNCDDATVRHAAHHGWKVELLHDAAGSLPYRNALGSASAEEIHRVFCVVMHTGFAAVCSTADWLAAVAGGKALAADSVWQSHQRALAGNAA